jgi:hypothetical protein
MVPEHAIQIVAPWYRWAAASVARSSVPVFQMYDTPDLVNAFLRDPTQSLDLSEPENFTVAQGQRKHPLRKIFLGSHQRFYLVVCELHCDAPLFPSASRGHVDEAKLVVRRRAQLSNEDFREFNVLLRRLEQGVASIDEEIRGFKPFQGRGSASRSSKHGAFLEQKIKERRLDVLRRESAKVFLEERLALVKDSVDRDRLTPLDFEQAWHGEPGGLGEWLPTAAEPPELFELGYPLYPLVPDPRDPNHPARGKTIYFGLLPTGSREVDARDRPRYDDRSEYLARCVIRRHDACCEGRPAGTCSGKLVWSRPTEPYCLAGFFDMAGNSHRAVTISMPGRDDLLAMTLGASAWKEDAAGLRVESQEKDMNVGVTADENNDFLPTAENEKDAAGNDIVGGATCVYPIPLLMIVATFVFKIFLAILMIVIPPLAFLAGLRICFPTGALPVRTTRPRKSPPPDPANAEFV